MATRTGGASQPRSRVYLKKKIAASTSAMPAMAEKSLTPTSCSQSKLAHGDDGGAGGAGSCGGTRAAPGAGGGGTGPDPADAGRDDGSGCASGVVRGASAAAGFSVRGGA